MNLAAARIPSATYRLQFHAGFTFRDALALLDYLDELGISDIYASPYFQASPESTHGYDVANHNRLNPAIGDDSDHRAFTSGLRQRGMGQILDFVPNHMGIGQSLNGWWMAVLEEGLASPYAKFFDIDWHPGRDALSDRVLLPLLGDRYGKVLEEGAFRLGLEDGGFFLLYYETRLPINPRSYPLILRRALGRLRGGAAEQMRRVLEICAECASAAEAKNALRELTTDAAIRHAIDETLRFFEGQVGRTESFDPLHELLEAQFYRLSYWRVAAEEINYRRFFDINTLAAIRVEIPEVFEAAHLLVFELLARGDVTGLRIDHIDGLWDPLAYLRRVQERYAQLCGRPLYLLVEKILDPAREQIPSDWPVHGATGYEFACQAVQLFTDSAAAKRMTNLYGKFTGLHPDYAELVYEKKKLTMQISLRSEIATLGRMLDGLSEMHRQFRDFTLNTLTAAVREVIACFPVYRTYVTGETAPSAEEEKVILRAIHAARRRNPSMEKSVFDFLRGVLLLRLPGHLTPEQREAHVRFVMRFQQNSGPVMAKGVEDTVFYIYNRLVALNEVGGNPDLFGLDPGEFHHLCATRLERHPHALLATSTHDTKRSEDVRMRIVALSEIPEEWRQGLKKWSRLNRRLRARINGDYAPSRNEEYLLYQTLAGSWPLAPEEPSAYAGRIQQYMTKALKEAKINSSWTEPNEEWEKAVMDFIDGILDANRSAEFLAGFSRLVERLAPLGAMNSLAQLVLKCTTPGVPDFYQGTELWDFSLVDPDNRRPVDYAARRQGLASLVGTTPGELVETWKSGQIKLHVTQRLLRLRHARADFFRHAGYHPLETTGTHASRLIAFSRSWNGGHLVVMVPRLTGPLGTFPRGEAWADTAVPGIPGSAGPWENILAATTAHPVENKALAATWLADFPLGVFVPKAKTS
ncbi:MAG: malto-oligosyltrehalose synthase [Terrimicrobiaceae bacterium]|nr:malto-oligosyltrehalose synthase [Terrimicrobiaceae bacterium]